MRELKEKLELSKPLKVSVISVSGENFISKCTYRKDYHAFKLTLRYHTDTYSDTDCINIYDYDIWKAWLEAAENVTLSITKEQLAKFEYFLRDPDVSISLHPDEFRINIKPNVQIYHVFGDLDRILRYNGTTHKYHVPLSEAARLYEKVQNTVHWDDDAREFAIEQLQLRSKLADIAKLEYSIEGDVKLENDLSLKPFQTVGVHYLKAIHFRGIIGDEMGLGKTLQAIGCAIKADAKRIAVVVPASVRENWRREILRATGEEAFMLGGTTPDVFDMQKILEGKYKWHILNYDMFSRPLVENIKLHGFVEQRTSYPWAAAINILLFDMVILDEAHRIKNVDAARTKAILTLNVPKIICLTGTPIVNRPGELWPALHLISRDSFNSHEGFLARYTDGKNGARNTQELKRVIAPFFIRRKKSEVVKDLPPIIRNTRFIELNNSHRVEYEKLMDQVRIDLSTGDEIGIINSVLEKILRIKQFLSYHKCEDVADFARDTYDEAEEDEKYKKIIIFSQFIDCVDRISRFLGGECLTIVGSRHSPIERQEIVDKFQRDPRYKFLICSIQAANEGLNITAAGHVIFNDFVWTPAAHQQAEGRAYGRIGDSHTIESHYFAVEDTLDDWLQQILRQKLNTIEEVVEGMADARNEESSIFMALFKAIRGGQL